MDRIRDSILAGALAGWLGNVPKEIMTWSFHFLGWIKYTFVHIASGFYYSAENLGAPLSLLTGAITDWVIAGAFGVMLLFILRYTGTDYAVFKGMGFGAVFYILAFGIGMALDISRATLVTPLPDFLLLMAHFVIGGVSGWALKRYFSEAVRPKVEQ
ncbi:MAG: hypothetical protein WBK48_01440 [Dethiobacteria bacterium]|jgi:hypothetical protein|nr:hypothetical protein [Bacillota bacterium]HOP69068.1 hypothetical protein [Bacillota bacterium]HPT34751.1 hypothetical protein [Bacillota bacterium]HPZ64224.1 hypothetical protein [Bacillota bacterium]